MALIEPKKPSEMDIEELERFLKTGISQSTTEKPLLASIPELKKMNSAGIVEEQLAFYMQKSAKLEEQVQFLEEQCKFARAETKRLEAQYAIDKQNWALQIEHLQKQSKLPIALTKLAKSRKK